eukprot:5356033-Lingulodinium_polyedra.AAC.1
MKKQVVQEELAAAQNLREQLIAEVANWEAERDAAEIEYAAARHEDALAQRPEQRTHVARLMGA